MYRRKVTLISIYFFLFSFLLACNNTSNTAMEEQEEMTSNEKIKEDQKVPFSVTATELCSDFSQNETNAIEKYENNIIDLTGEVLSFYKSEDEDCIFIELYCENENNSSITVSYCPDKDISLLEKIKEKESVTLQGKFIEKISDTVIMQQMEINSHPILD